jgi:hypothetical protein
MKKRLLVIALVTLMVSAILVGCSKQLPQPEEPTSAPPAVAETEKPEPAETESPATTEPTLSEEPTVIEPPAAKPSKESEKPAESKPAPSMPPKPETTTPVNPVEPPTPAPDDKKEDVPTADRLYTFDVDGIGLSHMNKYQTDTYSQHPIVMGRPLPMPGKRAVPFVLSYGIKDPARIWFSTGSSPISMFKTNGNPVDVSLGWNGTAIYLGYVVVDGLADGTKLMTITVTRDADGETVGAYELYYSGDTLSVKKV